VRSKSTNCPSDHFLRAAAFDHNIGAIFNLVQAASNSATTVGHGGASKIIWLDYQWIDGGSTKQLSHQETYRAGPDHYDAA